MAKLAQEYRTSSFLDNESKKVKRQGNLVLLFLGGIIGSPPFIQTTYKFICYRLTFLF